MARSSDGEKLFALYLKDHFAGSTGGIELAKRTAKANLGTEFAGPLERIATDIDEDREELKRIMGRLGVNEDPLKSGLAWGVEKAGRLKPNGQLRGYSPLSRMVELEGLIGGVSGKLSLWRMLRDLVSSEPWLDAENLSRLEQRAEDQLERLHELRGQAGLEAFA